MIRAARVEPVDPADSPPLVHGAMAKRAGMKALALEYLEQRGKA